MSVLRLILRRLALGVATAIFVLSAVFSLFTLTADWVLGGRIGQARFVGEDDDAVLESIRDQYLAERGLDAPFYELYLDWMINMVTLNWGTSFETGDPVFSTVLGATLRTATYAVPATVLAIGVGVTLGVYVALHPRSRLAGGGIWSAYLLFAVPNFWVGGLVVSLAYGDVIEWSPLLFEHVLPVSLAFTTLLGGYVSYSRAHAREYATATFTELVRAKGGSTRLVAQHVVRNAAVPFVSMLFTEALALLVCATFVVEVLFGIDGLGLLLLVAVDARDLPVLLGATAVIIFVGVLGTIIQDVAYGYLDPRVETGERRTA